MYAPFDVWLPALLHLPCYQIKHFASTRTIEQSQPASATPVPAAMALNLARNATAALSSSINYMVSRCSRLNRVQMSACMSNKQTGVHKSACDEHGYGYVARQDANIYSEASLLAKAQVGEISHPAWAI